MNKKNSKKAPIDLTTLPAPKPRWENKTTKTAKKVDSVKSTPMKVGGTLPEGAPGTGKKHRGGKKK